MQQAGKNKNKTAIKDRLISDVNTLQAAHRIRKALDNNMFALHAERIVPLYNSKEHYELLLRMIDGKGNIITPYTSALKQP